MKKLILFLFLSAITLAGYAQTLTLGRGLTGGTYNGSSNVTTTFDTAKTFTWLKAQNVLINNLGTTVTAGLNLTNSQAATNGAQQISPALHLSGRGYASTPAVSEPVDFYFQVNPLQGTTVVSGTLQLMSAVAGGGPVTAFQFSNTGGFVTATMIASANGPGITSTDGITNLNNTAATSGLNQWSRRFRWNGNAWNSTSSASQETDMIAELKTFTGNPITSRWALSSQINNGGYTERFGVADNGLFYLNSTALTANQLMGANSGATGMEAKTLSGSSATGLAVTNGTGTITVSNDTTKLQTIANFFPKADGRYLKTSTASSTYQPILGYTAANDVNVVHLTGNENIAGTKTFTDKLAIGTSTVPTGYQFAVNGSSIATSITVKAHTNWPDYVFGSQYKLMPLAEMGQYVATNHHLPDMPTAEQVAKDGQNLGEMNAKLLKQVEDLTLYLVEKDKQLKEQKAKIESQEERLKKIEKQLNIGSD